MVISALVCLFPLKLKDDAIYKATSWPVRADS